MPAFLSTQPYDVEQVVFLGAQIGEILARIGLQPRLRRQRGWPGAAASGYSAGGSPRASRASKKPEQAEDDQAHHDDRDDDQRDAKGEDPP